MSLPTDCSYIQPRLAPYLTGDLDLIDQRAVEMHVGICPSCCDELKRARDIDHLLRSSARTSTLGARLLVAQARPSVN
ncbi:MAG: zf-HC2 domain-containing protein [Nitriliruptoraceae bacterium]